ncbi:MAG: hypothetical protein KJ882_03100, partial [Proteobacteria bacterium]|nr:hypothetical protein [Pseudomonadota bacterium]
TALQDLLLYCLMGLSQVAVEERKVGISDSDINVFTVKAGFSIAKCARYLYKKFRYKTHFHS